MGVTVGLSSSDSSATQMGAVGPVSFSGGSTNAPNTIMWIVIGVVALVAAVLFLKKKRGGR